MRILSILNGCSADQDHSCLFWASCELLLASYGLKAASERLFVPGHQLLELLFTYHTTEWWQLPLWRPTQCTWISSSLCFMKSEPGMQVHCIGGQRGGRHHSIVQLVVFSSFLSLPCFCPFYRSIPSMKWSFFQEHFPLVQSTEPTLPLSTANDNLCVKYWNTVDQEFFGP